MIPFLAFLAFGGGPCLEVAHGRITAGELAGAIAVFSQLPPATGVALAPAPGVRRMLSAAEASRIAARFGLSADAVADLCVIRRSMQLERPHVLERLRAELLPEAEIDLIEVSRYAVPTGEIEFPRSGLMASPGTGPGRILIWKGRVRSPDGQSFPIWARVRLRATSDCWVAQRRLPRGTLVTASDLSRGRCPVGPFRASAAAPGVLEDDLIGKLTRRSFRAGERFAAEALESPPDVRQGQAAAVEVTFGGVALRQMAQAETSGRQGDVVWMRSASGQRFRGRVTGPGQVMGGEDVVSNSRDGHAGRAIANRSRRRPAEEEPAAAVRD